MMTDLGRPTLLIGLFLLLGPPVTLSDQSEARSKLAGSWALIEGTKTFADEEQPLPGGEQGRIYLVIKPDGSFYRAGDLTHSMLDDLRKKGDRVSVVRPGAYLEVVSSDYGEEASELLLTYHDGEGGDAYRIAVEAKLLPDETLSFRYVSPGPGDMDQVLTATLRRIESDRPWQPVGLIRELKGHQGDVYDVALSTDGRRLLSAGRLDNTVRLWDVETGMEIRRFEGHANGVCTVALSPNGRFAASGSRGNRNVHDDALRIWDLESGRELQSIDSFSTVTGLAFLADGESIVATGHVDRLSDKAKRGERISAGIWNLGSGERELRLPREHDVDHVAVSSDGRRILCGTFISRRGYPICVYDSATGAETRCFGEGIYGLESLAFSPDGRRALTASQETFVREWDLDTAQVIRRLDVDASWPTCAVYLPDGKRILTASYSDNSLHLWDLEAGRDLRRFEGHDDTVRDIEVSSDGRFGVSCSSDGSIRLWQLPPE